MMLFISLIAAQVVSPAVEKDREVVVRGRPLAGTEKALSDCLARNCPPDQDIDATLAHAENLFVAGDYKEARIAMLASIRRNKRAAKRYPVHVADLYRANARVSAHLGEPRAPVQNHAASLYALRDGLPPGDSRVAVQRMELANSILHSGRLQPALNAFRDIADDAAKAGDKRVEGYARFRRAVIYTALVEAGSVEYREAARKAIDWLLQRSDPAYAPMREGALVLSGREAIRKRGEPAVDELAARFGAGVTRPMVLHAPVVHEVDRNGVSGTTTLGMGNEGADEQWADIAYWITPAGRVADVEVVRGSPNLHRVWMKPYLQALAGRRYAPLAMAMAKDEPGLFRVERYTRVAEFGTSTASRMRSRSGRTRVITLDLTPDDAGQAK